MARGCTFLVLCVPDAMQQRSMRAILAKIVKTIGVTALKDPGFWGMVQRGTDNILLAVVHKRDRETLMPLINNHIPKASTIFHDDWPVYRNLEQQGYTHHVVVHSREFRASDGTHTNTIEGVWGVLKQRMGRMHGYTHDKLQWFLNGYTYVYKFIMSKRHNVKTSET